MKETEWVKLWTRKMQVLKADDYSMSTHVYLKNLFNKGIPHWIYHIQKGQSDLHAIESEYESFNTHIDELSKTNPNFFDLFIDDFEQHIRPHVKFLKTKINIDLSKLSDEELLELYAEYKESLYNFYSYLWIGVLDAFMDQLLFSIMERYYKPVEFEDVSKIILLQTESNYILEEEKALFEIKQLPKEKITEALKEHTQKFGYIPMYDYSHKPFSYEYFEKRLDEINPTNKVEELKTNKKKFEEFLKNSNLSEKDEKAIRGIHAIINMKDQRSHYRSSESYYGKNMLKEITKRTNVPLAHLCNMTSKEIVELIKTKKTNINFEEREKECVYFYEEGISKVLIGEEMENFKKDNLPEEKSKEIKGMGVSTGKITGRVVIVKSTPELKQLNKGDILVASMTRPEYITAMHKAGGFVTNEGGLICHAAIIARELKKPSIVGTGNATKILKTGDIIEVDADKGIVKILKE